MNAIEIAIRHYQHLVPEPITVWEMIPRKKLDNWLKTEVCAAIEPFWQKPRFRELAKWSVKELETTSGSEARRQLTEIDDALVNSAKSLLSIAKLEEVAEQLSHPRSRSGQKLQPDTSFCRLFAHDFAYLQARTRIIADRFWTDLVCPNDYFHPRGGWIRKEPLEKGVAEIEFSLTLNSDLPPIGDFVLHCLFIRLKSLRSNLEEFRVGCYQAVRDAKCNCDDLLTNEQAAWQQLDQLIRDFEILIRAGADAKLREACVIATHVYMAFNPTRDTRWLGISGEVIEFERKSIVHWIKYLGNSRIYDLIANAIQLVSSLNKEDNEKVTEVEKAIEKGGLVLTDDRRVFWERSQIIYNWRGNVVPWTVLWYLAKRGQAGNITRLDDVYEYATKEVLSNAIKRLRVELPYSLRSKIIAVKGEKAYQLDLKKDKIALFAKDPGRIKSRNR